MKARNPWIRLWPVWTVPAVVVALNVVWLTGLRGALLGRGSLLARQVAAVEADVAALESQNRHLQQTKSALTGLKTDIDALRHGQLGRMRDRLIPFLKDVVERAQEAGLKVERLSYAVQRDPKSAVAHFSATYSLDGAYDQIRRLIYLLESSPQFVIVEGLNLRGDESATSLKVTVNMTVGTFFSDVDERLLAELGVNEVKHDE